MAISRLDDGTFVDVNEMYLELFGYDRDAMLGRTSRELGIISAQERAALVAGLRADGSARNVALQTVTRTGERRDVLFSSEVVEVHGEQHMLSILHDITERRLAEEALRESEAELREAQKIAKLGIWTLDVVANTLQWSESFAFIHGRPPEWRGGSLADYLDLVHPEDRPVVERHVLTIPSSGKSVSFDYRILLPDGELRWMNVQLEEIKSENRRPSRLRGIVQGISTRVRLEGQLRQSQKLDAVGQLAGGIAHDFNNILGVIVGHIEMAVEDVPPDHPAQESLAAIKRASQRGAELVRRIVTVSSPRVPEGGVIRPRDIVEESIGLLRASLPAMLVIRLNMEEKVPAVKGNSTQLHQVLMNLANNAAHAMEGRTDGMILVEVKTVYIDTDTAAVSVDLHEGPYVRISISDNGHGMDRRTMERIFEPFFTTKGTGKGTGLGLAMVHGIVRSHGGAVTVYSEVDRGTMFRVYLPVSPEEAGDLPIVSDIDHSPGRGQRVICVDDEKELLDLMSTLLIRMGFHVTKESDPLRALEMIRAAPGDFDVLLTDLAMPGSTGMDLAQGVRAVRPGMPVILASGNFSEVDLRKAGEMGIRTVGKPATREDLARLLSEAVSPIPPP